MATNIQQRRIAERIAAEANEAGVNIASNVIIFFVRRAVEHIESRHFDEAVRDSEFVAAEKLAGTLIQNLTEFGGSQTVTMDDALEYIQRSNNCFYPFCRP